MEGLKLIAQSTFDRHQKFRPSGDGSLPFRYNVLEIGAFGAPSTSLSTVVSPTSATASHQTSGNRTVSKRQSVGSLQQQKSASGGGAGGSGAGTTHLDRSGTARVGSTTSTTKRVTLNEWMVHEDDLVAFMKKRPVEVVATASGTEDRSAKSHQQQQQSGSATTSSTGGHSKTFTSPTGSKNTETTSADSRNATISTTRRDRSSRPEEIEAVASLKLVCIPRMEPDLSASAESGISGDFSSDGTGNALAISREAFLRLYVDQMDADHCALYYLAREYDGFHEFNDHTRGIVTKFVGTSDYALIWTFNRRTLETKGLFLDRYHRWQPPDEPFPSSANINTRAPTSGFGSAPVTPSNKSIRQESSSVQTTPSKRWTKRQTGTVSGSAAWHGFRDTLKMYRKYVYAPQLLSFVACVNMLRAFDEEVNDEDLPSLRHIEANLGAFQQQVQHSQQHHHHHLGGHRSDAGDDAMHNRFGDFMRTQSSSFAYVSQQNQHNSDPFAVPPTTPPPPDYTNHNNADGNSIPTTTPTNKLNISPLLDTEKLAFQARATNRVDTSLANKLRHLKMARTVLELIARDHETVIVDVVAPAFLDRYHWTMEGMTEAIPQLERHIGSLEEYLGYLKGRAERLTGLVRSITTAFATCYYHHYYASAFAATASHASAVSDYHANNASASSSSLPLSNFNSSDFGKSCSHFHSSDASLALRCNHEADSRSDRFGGLLVPRQAEKHSQQQHRKRQLPADKAPRNDVVVPSGLGPGNALGIINPRPRPSSQQQHQQQQQQQQQPLAEDIDKTPTATTTATASPLSPPTPPLPTTSTTSNNASSNPTQPSQPPPPPPTATATAKRRPSTSTVASKSTVNSNNSSSILSRTSSTAQSRGSSRNSNSNKNGGFYASYLLRGHYSHRLA